MHVHQRFMRPIYLDPQDRELPHRVNRSPGIRRNNSARSLVQIRVLLGIPKCKQGGDVFPQGRRIKEPVKEPVNGQNDS